MFFRMSSVSASVEGSIITRWKRRSRAPSFSIELRYSSSVVAPIHCTKPRANAGFMILAASIEPGVLPAPIIVCISSMKTMMSGFCSNSCSNAWMRSSNCPRYFVPATIDVISRRKMRLLNSSGDVRRRAISWASPSAMALLPTPGSPISIGLFFFRRHSISVTRCISLSRPITRSSLPWAAASVRSVENLSSTGVLSVPPPIGLFVVSEVALCFLLLCEEKLSCDTRLSSSSDNPTPFLTFEFVCIRKFIAFSYVKPFSRSTLLAPLAILSCSMASMICSTSTSLEC